MPIILGAIGLGLGAVGTGASLFSQNQAKKAAKRAEEENRRTAAWNALMQAAAGGVPRNDFQAGVIPQVDYGGAISQLGSGVMSAGNMMSDNDYKNKLLVMKQAQATTANGFADRRIKVAEDTAKSNEAFNKARIHNDWMHQTGEDLVRMNQFENDQQSAEDLRKWREDQLNLKREQLAALAGKTKAVPGEITEGQAINIIADRKENDPMKVMLATQLKQPIPTGYTHSDKTRRAMAKLLKERRGWSDEDIKALLDESDGDPLGILGN